MEALKEHFYLHRQEKKTWVATSAEVKSRKHESQGILDKAALLVPTANLSYNFFERPSVKDFLIDLCEYRVRTSKQAVVDLIEKMAGAEGKNMMRRLDQMTSDFKQVNGFNLFNRE